MTSLIKISKLAWGITRLVFEQLCKMRRVLKTQIIGYLADCIGTSQQHGFGLINHLQVNVFQGGLAGILAEQIR